MSTSKKGTPPRGEKSAEAKTKKARAKATPATKRATKEALPRTLAGAPRKSTPPKRSVAPKRSSEAPREPMSAAAEEAPPSSEESRPEVAYIPRTLSSIPPAPDHPAPEVEAQIRALEERLDRLIDEASQHALPDLDDDDDEGHDDEAARVPPPRPSAPPSVRALHALAAEGNEPPADATVFDTARELLSTTYYLRQWGRLGMRNRSEEVDDFGYDPIYDQKVRPLFNFLYEKYFRVEVEGIEHVPDQGRAALVCNHAGALPYDGIMLKMAVKREHPKKRDLRWLAEDFLFHFPFLGSFTNRIGAVRACQENAERLLGQEQLVGVFPEGVKGIGKLYKDRYRLQRFGRGGFVKLCLRTRTPIIPVAIVGGEEASPMLLRIEQFSRGLGLPYIPVTPTFPLLGPLGLAPAPTKWKILFGEPIDLAEHGPEAADDEILVGRLTERVRATIQATLDRALGERRSVWFG